MCKRKQLLAGLNSLDLQLGEQDVDRLLLYCQELEKWNKRINLIARHTSPAEIVEKHFLDSLSLLPIINGSGDSPLSLLDIGTGAGFPGLVLAAVLPDLQVTLMEPRQKRVVFLRHIMRTLALTNVSLLERRLEPGEQLAEPEDGFTFITSRAVAAPALFLPLVEATASKITQVILMQADQHSWLNSKQEMSWKLMDKREFPLPVSGHNRSLLIVKKQ